MSWIKKKEFPLVKGYESLGKNIKAKRFTDFYPYELLDYWNNPIPRYVYKLSSIKNIAEFVITQFDYPFGWFGTPCDKHTQNYFCGKCCHTIYLDYWQLASETLTTLLKNKHINKKGYGDCEDTSILFTALMLGQDYEAREVLGVVTDESGKILGGHGWSVFEDENGQWRLFESTLDVPPKYPNGYPEIDIDKDVWKVGKYYYEGWVMFNHTTYWETDRQHQPLFSYLSLPKKAKETYTKYLHLYKLFELPITPLITPKKLKFIWKWRWNRWKL